MFKDHLGSCDQGNWIIFIDGENIGGSRNGGLLLVQYLMQLLVRESSIE